ncbi:staphylopine family metallophore export MFS transporter CntE [Paenibacillus sp. CAU 1782]
MKGALAWPFLRLYVLTLFYFGANSILNVLLPLKGAALGASNTTIGLVMGAYLFTTMLIRPWAGMIIQAHGSVKVLRIILLLNGAALLIYTFSGLEGYFAARMLQGVCTAFFSMALQLGIIDALPEKDRSQGISLYSLCAYLPGVIGPLFAIGIWQGNSGYSFTAAMVVIAVLTASTGISVKLEQRTTPPPNRDKTGESEDGKAEKLNHASNPVNSASTRDPAGTGKPVTAILQSYALMVSNRHLFKCSVLMLTASVVFGAATTFVPLYAGEVPGGGSAIFLMLQASAIVASRFFLRKHIPSDGKWHSKFVMTIMLMLTAAALAVSYASTGGIMFFYSGAVLMGTAQALLYPALTSYLTFVLPGESRNVLLGLFIATADLGASLGGIVMGPVSDLSSYSVMYGVCAVLAGAMIVFGYSRRPQVQAS